MKNKGQIAQTGFIVMLAMVAIVGVALFSASVESANKVTTMGEAVNVTYTTATSVNDTITLTGREATSTITVVNATSGEDWTSRFELVESAYGNQVILLKTTDDAVSGGVNGQEANISYTYKPWGYDNSTGGRSMIKLLIIMMALAIALSMIPGFRDWLGDKVGM